MGKNVTERQWLTVKSWEPLYNAVNSARNARKLRLFACACCRRLWPLLVDLRCRVAVQTAEAFADGVANKAELAEAGKTARRVGKELSRQRPDGWGARAGELAIEAVQLATHAPRQDLFLVMFAAADAIAKARTRTAVEEKAAQGNLLRDIFGNPFRPVAFAPEWRTDTAAALAKQMYESRDFGAMPILADALQEAGCDSEEVLNHCRGDGPHVRGCWVVDLVLGKK